MMKKLLQHQLVPCGTCSWEALAESPVVRAFEALCAWAEQPEGRAVLLAIHEWATVDCRLQEHRRRWEQEGIPISAEEAEYALRCLGWAAFNEQVEPAQYLAPTLENNPSEEVFAKYIERAKSEAPYWDALAAYKESHGGDVLPMLSEWPSKGVKGEGQFGTGVAYANPSATPAFVTFTARDAAGEVLARVVRTLLPGGHDAHGMMSLFGLTSFTGSIEVTSTEPIVSLSLNFEAAPVFSSLPPGELDASVQ